MIIDQQPAVKISRYLEASTRGLNKMYSHYILISTFILIRSVETYFISNKFIAHMYIQT